MRHRCLYYPRALVLFVAVLLSGAVASAPAAPTSFKPDQAVEAREGDEWSAATVVKTEGRKVQIRYADGTEEWVTADRLRVQGTAGAAADDAAAATDDGADAPEAGAAKKPKESYPTGGKVEVKLVRDWKRATVKNRDGDLYLVVVDGEARQMWWRWVHVSGVRKIGSDKEGPGWADSVMVGGRGLAAAKETARSKFAKELNPEGDAAKPDPANPAAPAGAEAAATPTKSKDTFKTGDLVELKRGKSPYWEEVAVRNRDGELYLIVRKRWRDQRHWEWVHVSMIRTPGTDKVGGTFDGVAVGRRSIDEAKEEARRLFASAGQLAAAEEKAAAEAAKSGGRRSPWDPLPYDKPVTKAKLADVNDVFPDDAPAKLASPDAAPGAAAKPKPKAGAAPAALAPVTRLVNKVPLKAGAVVPDADPFRQSDDTALVVAGSRALVVTLGGRRDQHTGSIESLDLATGKSLGRIAADALSMPVGVSPSGGRVVGVQHGQAGGKRRVDLHTFQTGPKAVLAHVISFIPYTRPVAEGNLGRGERQDVIFAAFVGGPGDEDHVVTCSGGGSVVVWDAPKATAVWRGQGRPGVAPAVSPGGKQVAVLGETGLAVYDALNGAILCLVPGGPTVDVLRFTPDGRRVVGIRRGVVSCWDVATGELMPDIGLGANPARADDVRPLDGRFVLVGGTDLLDLDKKLVVWSYSRGSVAPLAAGPDGRCWSLVADGKRAVLAATTLPHAAARKAADAIAPGQGLLLGPGGRVSLSISVEGTEEQRKKVTTGLTEQLQKAGLTIDPASPLRLVAQTLQGKTETQTYEVRQPGEFSGSKQTVSVTQKITRLAFEHNGRVVWETSWTSGHAPLMLLAKKGQSMAEAAAEQNQYDPSELVNVRVPAYVPAPSQVPWQGKSAWSAKGIVDEQPAAAPAGVGT